MEIFAGNRGGNEYGLPRSPESGTLMLDEITELDPQLQLKLLRILKEQDVNKGAVRRGTAADARVIACTHKNVNDEVNAQRFRNDLYFKLHVIQLDIEPLRTRTVDIDFYSEIFLREYNIQFSKNVQLSPTAKQALRTYTWPGNVRELRNVVQRSVLLATRDYISVEELHLMKANSRTEVAMSDALPQITLRELEQRLILQTLRRMNGNRTHTAKALGISLRALRYKLNELVDCGYEVEGKNV
jgi:two-component system response regulator AtoC